MTESVAMSLSSFPRFPRYSFSCASNPSYDKKELEIGNHDGGRRKMIDDRGGRRK